MDVSLTSASKEYADLVQKQIEIDCRRAGLLEERSQLLRELQSLPPSYVGTVAPEVLELIEAADGSGAARSRIARARVHEIEAQLPSFSEALELLVPRISEARHRASAIICESIRPEYQRRVAAVCAAFIALDKRYAELLQMMEALNDERVAWGALRPMHVRFVDQLGKHGGDIERYVREAIEYDLVPDSFLSELKRS